MSIQCKAYLLQNGAKEPTEIRSFRLDEGAISNYEYLRKKVATIFPSLGWDEDGSALKLLWKDASDDLVTFSSDEELVDALGQITDGVFRLYIKHTASKKSEFPWPEYVNEFLKNVQGETQNERGCPSFGGHPYARRGGCGGRRNFCLPRSCFGPQRSEFPAELFLNLFPGIHAEVYAFNGCGQKQAEKQSEDPTKQQEKTPPKDDSPSTSKPDSETK